MNKADVIVHVPLRALRAYSPFDQEVWGELDRPITREEVLSERGCDSVFQAEYETRLEHIRRVAWLVDHCADSPISIDVGGPSLSSWVGWIVFDGNHRHAAAIIRGDRTIPAYVSGEVSHAERILQVKIGDHDTRRKHA